MCIFVSLQLSHKFMYTLIIVIFMFYNASRNMIQQLSGLCIMIFVRLPCPC